MYGPSQEKIDLAKAKVEEALGYTSNNNNQIEDGASDDDFIDWGKIKDEADEAQKAKWAKCPQLLKNFYQEQSGKLL